MRLRDVLFFFTVMCCIIVAVVVLPQSEMMKNALSVNREKQDGLVSDVSVQIVCSDWQISYVAQSTPNVTVALLLDEASDTLGFDLQKEFWTGYDSFFIESINGTSNGDDDCFWQYYVNGDFASVGCSSYYLEDGDRVMWSFESTHWG